MTEADWDDLKLFLHVATEGGLSGAAARSGLSAPTIGRRMLALERTSGRTLFVRSQQGYRLAPDGETLLAHVLAMQKAADGIAGWRSGALALPIVSIGANAWLAGLIAENAMDIRRPEDGFRLCCKALHKGFDMTHREADVGIVGDRPRSGNVAARPTVDIAHAVYRASGRASAPDTSDDIPWISIGTESAGAAADRWVFQNHEAGIRTWTNSPELLLRLIVAGNGRGVLPCFIGDRTAGLARDGGILADLTETCFIVANDDDRHRPEVRLVIERLHALFRRERKSFAGDRPQTE